MTERTPQGRDPSVNWYMTAMPEDTPIPKHVYMPWSTMMTFRHVGRHPAPEDMYALTAPAIRAFHEAAPQKARSSMNTTALLPFLNMENTSSLTRAVQQWMYADRNALPKTSRLRGVMGNAVFGTDADFLSQGVDADGFVHETRPRIVRTLLSHYLGFPGATKIAERISQQSMQYASDHRTDQMVTRKRTKYFIPALDALEVFNWDVRSRWVELVIDQGVWENDPGKPYLDASFYALQHPLWGPHRTRLISIGTAPNFVGNALANDIRRAPWTLTWDHLGDADLVPVEALSRVQHTNLIAANREAGRLMKLDHEYPERRTQVAGIFAQNTLVRGMYPPYMWRLKQDMLLHESPDTLDVLLRPMHCDESLRDQIPTKILGQAKRAIRKDGLFATILKRSEEGQACLKTNGIAVDAPTVAIFRECPTPEALQRQLREMAPDDRDYFLGEQMGEDFTILHDPFNFITTFRALGQFRFYDLFSRVRDHEWDNVYAALENRLGEHGLFSKKMYILNHPREIGFKTEDGRRSPYDMWMVGDIFRQYKNPFVEFLGAMRDAKIRSSIVRYALHPQVPYLEAIEQFLTMYRG